MKKRWRNKNYRKKMILLVKTRWRDENFRKKMMGKMGKAKHPFFRKGKQHASYKNGSGSGHRYKFVLLSIKLLGKKCQDCGTSKNVYTHHKDSDPRNNPLDGSNWKRLCSKCHKKLFWSTNGKYKYGSREGYKLAYQKKTKVLSHLHKKNKIKEIENAVYKKFGIIKFISPAEITKILGLSCERIRQMRNEEKLNYIKFGGQYFYPQSKYLTNKNNHTSRFIRLYGATIVDLADRLGVSRSRIFNLHKLNLLSEILNT